MGGLVVGHLLKSNALIMLSSFRFCSFHIVRDPFYVSDFSASKLVDWMNIIVVQQPNFL